MEHTPGPWRFQREHTVSFEGSGAVAFPIYNTSDKFAHVATAMSEANARLIAAAPELLGALKEIAKGEGPFSLDHMTHASNTIEAMKALARAAIAKAEGTVKVE